MAQGAVIYRCKLANAEALERLIEVCLNCRNDYLQVC